MVDQGGLVAVRGLWWELVLAGTALIATVLAVNFVGDGVRDALGPSRTIDRE